MSIIAKPLNIAYRNQGEYGYKLGIEVYEADDNGNIDFDSPVTITGDVKLIWTDLDGSIYTEDGAKSENQAYYTVQQGDFDISGSYRYWIQCFNREIYGPYELKIQLVGGTTS